MYVVKSAVPAKTGRYSKKKRERSDAFLHGEHIKKHLSIAFLKNTGFNDTDIVLVEPDRKQDINFGLDGEFYIPKKEQLKVTGRVGFRCRTYDNLRYCDLTITEGIKNGQAGEFYKSRANTMLYGYENKEKDPNLGFSLFTVIEFQQTANLLKTKRLHSHKRSKPRSDGDQNFFTVSFSDLYDHNLLLYVGTDYINTFVEETIVDTFPEPVWRCILDEGYWSFFQPHHQSY